jgi:hypothetical protein
MQLYFQFHYRWQSAVTCQALGYTRDMTETRAQYHKVNIYMMTLGELWKYCLPRDTSFLNYEVPFDLFDCAMVRQLDQ